eukprot:1646286-Rhodomonas_salina.4
MGGRGPRASPPLCTRCYTPRHTAYAHLYAHTYRHACARLYAHAGAHAHALTARGVRAEMLTEMGSWTSSFSSVMPRFKKRKDESVHGFQK